MRSAGAGKYVAELIEDDLNGNDFSVEPYCDPQRFLKPWFIPIDFFLILAIEFFFRFYSWNFSDFTHGIFILKFSFELFFIFFQFSTSFFDVY